MIIFIVYFLPDILEYLQLLDFALLIFMRLLEDLIKPRIVFSIYSQTVYILFMLGCMTSLINGNNINMPVHTVHG